MIKPQRHVHGLNRQHPLARPLVAYWPIWEAAGSQVQDVVNGNHGTINGATWVTGERGPVLRFDGVSNFMSSAINPLAGLGELSIHVRIKSRGTGNADRIVSNGTEDDLEFAINRSGAPFSGIPTNHAILFIRNDTGWQDLGDISGAVNFVDLLLTVQDGLQVLYLDGFPTGTTAARSFADTDVDGVFVVADRFNNVDSTHDCDIDDIAIYNVALSSSQALDLFNSPYRLITPGEQTIPVEPAAPAAGSPWYQYAQEAAVAG